MCNKGEKSCPICTEEMYLTDQQLKPCKCGYEICVWCWHHIMEMSEKDGADGRCPACLAPYDKQRIAAMAANCQRLVAEMSSQSKKKMQKLKPKSSEGRKHLSDIRVIQPNMVYIIGLPLNLADEDLLKHREYFGRYGKVLKVSISRTATGLIQHSANNVCCVYVTYSKEVEAVQCIQSVHCFVLEGRSLRACFGTTKYCHAWLRNLCQKAHASSPPGFSMSSRIPPGFLCGRVENDCNTPVMQEYVLPSGNIGRIGDVEFNNDPAILEIGRRKERRVSQRYRMLKRKRIPHDMTCTCRVRPKIQQQKRNGHDRDPGNTKPNLFFNSLLNLSMSFVYACNIPKAPAKNQGPVLERGPRC